MATHVSLLAWKIPWTEGLVDYDPWGARELDMAEATKYLVSWLGSDYEQISYRVNCLKNIMFIYFIRV